MAGSRPETVTGGRSERTGPTGGVDVPPTAAGPQLWVLGELGHRPQPCVRDAHFVETLGDLVGRQLRQSRLEQRAELGVVLDPRELRLKRGSSIRSGRTSTSAHSAAHSRSFCTPMNTWAPSPAR